MEILSSKDRQELLNYLPQIKQSLKEWALVEIRLTDESDKSFSIVDAAKLVHTQFSDRSGKLYICNNHEILMLVHWGTNPNHAEIGKRVESGMPDGVCEVRVHEPTPEGIAKIELLVTYRKHLGIADIRRARKEKIILVADDDMYMRLLVKKGIGADYTVHEVASGKDVVKSYKIHAPDMLLLDIHMPEMDGTEVLRSILDSDPNAYVVMLSADSSAENVAATTQSGAKGFLTKPFSKDKLQEYIRKCPTIAESKV